MNKARSAALRWWYSSALYIPLPRVRARTLHIIFGLWVVAFAFKHAGASWDVAWHFRFRRDDMIPPHMLNLFGNGIAGALLLAQFRTGVGVERRSFKLMIIGFIMFVVAVPLDVLNHRLFGLDVTIWSPPHLTLFLGSTIVLAGLIWMLVQVLEPGPWKRGFALYFFMLLMDCMIFVLAQYEYGVLSVDAYLKGHPTASADLLALAGINAVGFATGFMPYWVYPVWMVLTGSGVLLIARRLLPGKWTATLVAICYLAYRLIAYALLVAGQFPPSFIPVMLLAAGLALDLAERWKWRSVATMLALVAAFYGSAAVVGYYSLMPLFAPWTMLIVAIPLWFIIAVADKHVLLPKLSRIHL